MVVPSVHCTPWYKQWYSCLHWRCSVGHFQVYEIGGSWMFANDVLILQTRALLSSRSTKEEVLGWWWKDRMEKNMIWWCILSESFKVFWEHRGVGLVNLNVKWGRRFWGKLSWWGCPELHLEEAKYRWCRKLPQSQGTECQVSHTASLLKDFLRKEGLRSPAFYGSLIGTLWKCSSELFLQKPGSWVCF